MTPSFLDAHDFSTSPLGPPSGWPQEVRTVVALMLRSRMPQWLALGPELCLVYNEACVAVLGDRHPGALGRPIREVWAEVWDEVEPLVTRALAGEPVYFENRPFRLYQNGAWVDTWFTFSYAPILIDERPYGLQCLLQETTGQVLAERERSERSARLNQLWQQAPGFVAVTHGPSHVYELCNRAYLRLVGDRPLVGLPLREALPELDPVFHQLLDRVYATGEAYVGRRTPVGLRREADGAIEQRVVDFVFQPIREADGRVGGIFIQGHDITEQHQAELAGEADRLRLRTLLDALPIGIAYADPKGTLQTVNAALRDVWGDYPLSDEVGEYAEWKGWWPAGHPRAGRRLAATDWPMARALAGERVAGELVEIEPFGLPGTRRTILLHSAPVRDAAGSITGAITAQQDVSDRVQAEAAVRASEARFRTIANAMPQMVWSTLPDGWHDFYNDQWYDYTGVPRGSTDGEGWNGMFHPEDQPVAWARWSRSLATGEPYEIEYRLRHRSGEYRWVLGRALPVRDDDGRIVRWMGTCTDIHEQKLAREALADSEARFRSLAANIPQLAWMADSAGWIFWYNDRWYDYTGTTLESMQGWGWREVHHPDHVERVLSEVGERFARGEPWQDTYLLRGADGVYRWFLTQAVPLRDADGRVSRWFGTNTDVTAQREAEDALREADRRKDEFLAMLAHELRNPLAPISTAAELLRLPGLPPERVRDASLIIGRQVRHMAELVDDLLDVSRVTRGLITLEEEVFDAREAVAAAIEQVRPLLEAREHALATRSGDRPAWVRGDRTRITQVVANLLNNAAKYSPPQGRIELATAVEDEEVVLSVRDEGQGIDPAFLPRVFDLFAQGERSPDRAQGGLGIGLALVRSLVALHGGRVSAASDGAGRGSRFTVCLPLAEAPQAAAGAPRALAAPARGLSVVVVDDNVDAAQTLQALLEAFGHRVQVRHDAASTLALPADVPVDAYLLDIGLPDLSGHELARRLRADPRRRGARLYALTGYGQDGDRAASEAAGFDRHFVKPVDPEVLRQALDAADAAAAVEPLG